MTSNRIQIFSELVSLEAWHIPLTGKRNGVSLHADLTFGEARLGGEEGSPVRFKLSLKQAILTAHIPETEPLLVDRASVARHDPQMSGVQKSRAYSRTNANLSARLGAAVGKSGISPRLDASGGASMGFEQLNEQTKTQKLEKILVRHSLDGEGNHRWRFQPGLQPTLDGKPWLANQSQLMKLRREGLSTSWHLGVALRLELTCLREDLHISDIRLKDEGLVSFAKRQSARRIAAAEAYIRVRLEEQGLPTARMSEDYATITLSRVSSIES